MTMPRSGSPLPPQADEKPSIPAWKLKDYGIGPEPPRGSWEWFEWIETRALIAGLEAASERQKANKT